MRVTELAEAVFIATKRADVLLDQGDMLGASTWIRMAKGYIDQIESTLWKSARYCRSASRKSSANTSPLCVIANRDHSTYGNCPFSGAVTTHRAPAADDFIELRAVDIWVLPRF